MDDSKKTLICRKCGGNHLTIKCGKVKEEPVTKFVKTTYNNNKLYKIKISNLPNNVEYEEINDFVRKWGHINKINVRNYHDTSIAIIEFKFEDEVEYFIKALDSTVFDHFIIKVEKID
jgi:RNA recognition motif-containing protein